MPVGRSLTDLSSKCLTPNQPERSKHNEKVFLKSRVKVLTDMLHVTLKRIWDGGGDEVE